MNTLCSNDIPVTADDCRPRLAREVSAGGVLMETKTIYNHKTKTEQQLGDILMIVQDQFLLAHPDFEYSDLKYEDGKHGERTFYLIFKRKL